MSMGLLLFTFIACFCQLGAYLTCQGPCIDVPAFPGAKNGSCVFMTKMRTSWFRSNLLCESYGAQPVVIPDNHSNDVIHAALRRLTPVERPWIGGHVTSHPWTWVNGSPFYNQTGCCSGLLNATVHRLQEMTPSLCLTSCQSHQYQYAYVKKTKEADICGCSNITCTDPGSSTCQAVCDGNWSAVCPTDWNNSVVGYEVNDQVQRSDHSDTSNSCGVLWVQDGGWTIGAYSCREPHRFLCENGSISPSTKYLSFLDARMFCLDRGSDLLVIANIQSNLTELDEGIYWIGLKRFSVMWYPGEMALFYSLRDFDSHFIGGCFFVGPMAIRGQWFVDNCTRLRHALCIQGPDVQALPDAESVPQNDSVVFTPAERPVAWCRAEEVCQDNGGHLVVIPNHHIESLVLKVVHEDVWIGGHIPRQPWTTVKDRRLYKYSGCCLFVETDEVKKFSKFPNCAGICVQLCGQEGFLYAYLKGNICGCSNATCSEDYIGVCPDTCPGLPKLEETCGNYEEDFYTVYKTTELDLPPWGPDELQTVYHCAALKIQGSTAYMTSWGCDKTFRFLCSVNDTDYDYITVHQEEVSWLKARQHCVEKGEDLATVGRHSPLLKNLTGGFYWIGVSQFKLLWHTGKPMVYNGLDSFDDSHVGGCVRISNRRPFWNTAFCDKELKPLCFKEHPQTSTPSSEVSNGNSDTTTSRLTEKTTSSSRNDTSVAITTQPTSAKANVSESDWKVELIVGCTVAVVLAAVLAAVVVCCVLKNRKTYVMQHNVKYLSSPMLKGNSATALEASL